MDIGEPTAAQPDDEVMGDVGEEHGEAFSGSRERANDCGEGSGWVSTKQAAKALGVSRRMVQEYVRRGKLEALTEGQGVSKTYYVSIDSLSSLRERRGSEANDAPPHGEVSSRAGCAANRNEGSGEVVGEVLRDTIERLEARAAEAAELKARLELTVQAESSLREALERERERADRLEAELREVRNLSLERTGSSETSSEGAANKDVAPSEARETLQRRSWLYRFFFGS